MSWELKKILQKRRDNESGAIVRDRGARTPVALVAPSIYAVGMGNLAIHALYRMMNSRPDIACERAFLPERREIAEHERTQAPLMSLEQQEPLATFDVLAFSISFENDLLNLLPILELARIPHRAEERPDDAPLLIAGGAASTLNPRPIAGIFDAIALGESECFVDDLFPILAARGPKREKLAAMAAIPGVWVPALEPSPDAAKPRFLADLDNWPTQTTIYSDAAEFGGMHLIELQRGCPFHCAFCATPAIYGSPRRRGFDAVMAMVEAGLPHRKKFGLIGAHILSHPQFAEIARAIHARGATFSPSSVRAADLDEEKVALLAASGHRSIALGIEAGSEKLRDAAGKDLSDAQIDEAVELLARAGITNLRLYFMIGLPGEAEEDIAAIATLACRVREGLRRHAPKAARQTSVAVTLSPFVPKPRTPFAREPFIGEADLKKRIAAIKGMLGKERGISVSSDAPLSAAVEAYLASADAGARAFLEEVRATGSIRRALPC